MKTSAEQSALPASTITSIDKTELAALVEKMLNAKLQELDVKTLKLNKPVRQYRINSFAKIKHYVEKQVLHKLNIKYNFVPLQKVTNPDDRSKFIKTVTFTLKHPDTTAVKLMEGELKQYFRDVKKTGNRHVYSMGKKKYLVLSEQDDTLQLQLNQVGKKI